MNAHLVIGTGKAGTWSNDASAVEKSDVDLLATAKRRGLYDEAHGRVMLKVRPTLSNGPRTLSIHRGGRA